MRRHSVPWSVLHTVGLPLWTMFLQLEIARTEPVHLLCYVRNCSYVVGIWDSSSWLLAENNPGSWNQIAAIQIDSRRRILFTSPPFIGVVHFLPIMSIIWTWICMSISQVMYIIITLAQLILARQGLSTRSLCHRVLRPWLARMAQLDFVEMLHNCGVSM